ncbi:iron uptake transporter permease EfeU [Nocardioides sp. KR10-350]|uniref:iron uptake transporter permease EfeU n=1 Tax=Nocardioides cheoyonin TaxID=3156615 RepID=UPI0032B412D0
MLPTFVIGLREGLEAALIVSIVATFLRRNAASLRGLWLGVGAGVLLSVAVGVVLKLVEESLPQRQQEAMETVIGGVAVFFVTGMVLWMRTHARTMKRELETAAAAALKDGTTTALAVMAFLAVLREGFETSVFLLATFQSAGDAPAAMTGAVLGILVAVGLGWGIYAGGVRLNLARFFKVTGVFLVLVAAGLVMSALRTGHEAGWVTVGQGSTVDLTWLTPNGSIRSALVTGVLGIPTDPRVVEVLGWAAYLVPMLALMFWPARLRPSPALAQRLRLIGAGAMAVVAVGLFALVRQPSADVPAQAPVSGGGTAVVAVDGDHATLTADGRTTTLTHPTATSAEGADTRWTATKVAGDLPSRLDVDRLLTYTGNRIPVGLSVATAPGPYAARWSDSTGLTVLTRDGGLVDARTGGRLVLTISGGGLTSPRTFTVEGAGSGGTWTVDEAYAADLSAKIADADAAAHDRTLWKHWVPVALLLGAALLLVSARRHRAAAGPAVVATAHDPARTEAAQAPAPEGTTTHADSLA